YYTYDQMNRQTLVDGTTATGGINAAQGHRVTYDKDGNRHTDTRVTNRVSYAAGYYTAASGEVTETYWYDAMNWLTQTVRDDGVNNATVIDNRYYDKGSRALQTGAILNATYAQDMNAGTGDSAASNLQQNQYDAKGRLYTQTVQSSTDGSKYTVTNTNIDAVGNVLGYQVDSYQTSTSPGNTAIYTTTYKHFDSYEQSTISVSGYVWGNNGTFAPTSTTSTYDANGYLVNVAESGDPYGTKTRTMVNDANGQILSLTRWQGTQQELIVNGEVLGNFGTMVDATKPLDANGNAQYDDQANFNFGYQTVKAGDAASASVHTVANGDTLAGLAQAYYGDSSLWYVIADANG